MSLETATYIDQLVSSNPSGTDSRTTADDHLRLIKAALLRTFTGIAGAVTGTHTTLNRTNDLTSSAQLQLDALKDGKISTTGTAQYADSANSAASAVYAFSANNATSAVFATSASNASSALYAFSAGNATSAVYAFSATNATSAVRSNSAVYADSADHATSAGSAQIVSGGAVTSGTIPVARIPNASVGGDGLVEFATTAEYQTGTDYTRAIPAGLFATASNMHVFANPGCLTLPGGLLLNWGVTGGCAGSGGTVSDSFARTFGTVYSAIGMPFKATASSTTGAGLFMTALSTTGLTFKNLFAESADGIYWFAIGKI